MTFTDYLNVTLKNTSLTDLEEGQSKCLIFVLKCSESEGVGGRGGEKTKPPLGIAGSHRVGLILLSTFNIFSNKMAFVSMKN